MKLITIIIIVFSVITIITISILLLMPKKKQSNLNTFLNNLNPLIQVTFNQQQTYKLQELEKELNELFDDTELTTLLGENKENILKQVVQQQLIDSFILAIRNELDIITTTPTTNSTTTSTPTTTTTPITTPTITTPTTTTSTTHATTPTTTPTPKS